MKTIVNGNKKVVITRSKLSDGYNYYLMMIVYSEAFNCEFWNENYRQTESILSLNKAIETAKGWLN